MLGATKPKFRGVEFSEINVDDKSHADLVAKYQVTGIPKLVFLDDKGETLYNGGAPMDEVNLTELIGRYAN